MVLDGVATAVEFVEFVAVIVIVLAMVVIVAVSVVDVLVMVAWVPSGITDGCGYTALWNV